MSILSQHIMAPSVHPALSEVPVSADDRIATAIELWLFDKYSLTQSKCTATTYREILCSLRAYLQAQGVDLDSLVVDVVSHIQTWASLRASTSRRQGDVAPSTYNQRIAAVSSFY